MEWCVPVRVRVYMEILAGIMYNLMGFFSRVLVALTFLEVVRQMMKAQVCGRVRIVTFLHLWIRLVLLISSDINPMLTGYSLVCKIAEVPELLFTFCR